MDIDDVHERMNVVAPFHDRYDGVDEYGSLVADDVAAKNFVVVRNEQFTQAMFFFQPRPLVVFMKGTDAAI